MAAGASVQTAAAGGFRVAVGTKVYVPCPKAVWATAEVLAVDADGLISAKLDDGDSVVQLKKDEPFYLCNTGVCLSLGWDGEVSLPERRGQQPRVVQLFCTAGLGVRLLVLCCLQTSGMFGDSARPTT